jgi:protein SCO1/2
LTAVASSLVGGGFSLTNHFGHHVTDEDYRGRYVLVFFGFTHCRIVCPRALGKIATALATLGALRDRLQALYVTIDPERDTQDVMRRFIAAYPGFIGLTGSGAEIEAARKSFRVFVGEPLHEDDGYQLPHSAFTHLLDPAGRHVDHWSDILKPDEIAARLTRHLLG